MSAKRLIFVSHCSADSSVVDDFVEDILEGGIGVPEEQIFYTSRKGTIPAGKYYIPYIREKVQESALLIAWITPRFFESPFCMCELGAAWASLPDGFVPILDGIGFDKLRAILEGMQVLLAKDPTSYNELREKILASLVLPGRDLNRWEKERKAFMTKHI